MQTVDGIGRRNAKKIILAALLAGLLTGCRHPDENLPEAGTLGAQVGESQAAIPAEPTPYTLAAGDELSVKVRQDPTLDAQIKLDSDGRFQFAYVGSVKAEGLTTGDLRKKIAQGLTEYIVEPDVIVNLVSAEQQFAAVMGEAEKPGRVALRPGMRITDVIAEAGGATEDADRKRVVLIRRTSEDRVEAGIFNFYDAMYNPTSTSAWKSNLTVQRGDTIYIPRSDKAQWESIMQFIGTTVNPLIDVERGIVLYPDVESVISTGDKGKGSTVIVR